MIPSVMPAAWPSTVAIAAPAVPMAGRPHQPKMKKGSRMMLVTAPNICVHMESLVSPVDWSSFSMVICMYMKSDPMVTMRR